MINDKHDEICDRRLGWMKTLLFTILATIVLGGGFSYSQNEGMKTVVNSLLKSIPQLMNVLLISLLFYLVFGILGVQVLKGSVGVCTDGLAFYKEECTGTFVNNMTMQEESRIWEVPFNNYDNIIYAMITFFEVSTLEMWPDVMFRAIDSTGAD